MIYPLKLKFVPKTALWGGNTLKSEWNKPCDFEKLAETWELTVRDDAVNVIENGEYSGRTLDDFIKAETDMGGEKFPLLIKFIDAEDKLSVQVHPDDKFAAEVENDVGKTEMWYIADAKDGAEIIYGIKDNAGELKCDSRIAEQVKTVKVKKGDSFFIPSGMLHAIGRGCLIAEIQQNSDLTYRVYDYERRDAEGNLRQLHTEKALNVIRPFDDSEVNAIRYSQEDRLGVGECLASCEYFNVNRLTVDKEQTITAPDGFRSLLCLEGEGEIVFDGNVYQIKKGDSYFLPKSDKPYSLIGKITALLSRT